MLQLFTTPLTGCWVKGHLTELHLLGVLMLPSGESMLFCHVSASSEACFWPGKAAKGLFSPQVC